MTPLAPLVDDGLREEPIAQNDDNELLDLLNDLQGPMREMEYDEDEEEFGDEMLITLNKVILQTFFRS